MIKLLFRLLFFAFAIGLIAIVLYVFDLPPFQAKLEIAPTNSEETNLQNEESKLPENLKENKVGRQKTYEEMIERAKSLEQSNFPALAIAQYQEAYKKDPSKIDPLYEIGKIHLRNNAPDKAESIFEDILEKSPNDNQAKLLLSRSLLAERKISEAKKILNTINDNTQITKYYQGIVAAYFGENDQAKKLLNESIAIGGNDDLTKKANNFLAAYNEYDFNVDAPELHLKVLLARSYNQCGEYQMAIPLLFEVTKVKLDYRDAWVLLGYAYLKIEKYQDAIDALEKAKVLDSQKPETLFYLGLGYYSMNNFIKAEENLSKAKEFGFEPKILVDQKLAEVYLELKNYQKSAASYETVISLNSQDVNYFIRPIWIYLEKLNEPEKAYQLALKAATKHPGEAMSQNLMGWTLIYKKDYGPAETHLKSAMGLDPKLDAVYLNMGLLYEKKSENEKALAFYKKAHSLGKSDGVAAAAATRYNNLIAKINNQTLTANTLGSN
ncbi:tetratricopeptide repeat protein [Candidatus Peregrinibacteria bacterium]|nr:tetratricopeptide repeat protein [Candidatus Peregrinibacteria bacterium]